MKFILIHVLILTKHGIKSNPITLQSCCRLNALPQISQLYFLSSEWTTMCCRNTCDELSFASHFGQSNVWSECVSIWNFSRRSNLNLFWQTVQANGKSSLWITWCSFSTWLEKKPLPQSWQINENSFSCTARICMFRLLFEWKVLLQCAQRSRVCKDLGKCVRWCFFKEQSLANLFGHFAHENGFLHSGCFFCKCS